MSRLLSNLKFWALALCLIWIVGIVAMIALNPGFAHGMK
ncbi:hypothetical protein A4R44_05331 [Amycolatopsis sp. M39]|uniref:Uncharacterized protein n=1 Tax=Amycolatopsis rubida TaxID=112413 RepID=A0A1I6AE29_9PSEU|nr:hypothetical protein A4R44_05331 [Amycolatopsis sp. M39]SFQ66807.1 hypothetical protein SAMN05421854_118122 [Amycolatopsis rubida]